MSQYHKIVTPKQTLIEQVAGQFAAQWYEIGRTQGLTSVHKTAKAYAKANLVRFIPNATKYLLDLLNSTSGATNEMREMIYEAMMERVNDPGLNEAMPNVNITKALELAEQMKKPADKLVINTEDWDNAEKQITSSSKSH